MSDEVEEAQAGEMGRAPFSAPVEQRGAARTPVHMSVLLRKCGGQKLVATLVNATIFGFCARANFRSHPEEYYFLRIPGLESLPVNICWSDGDLHGLALDTPLHPAVFRRLFNQAGLVSAFDVPREQGGSPTPELPRKFTGSRRDQIMQGQVPHGGILEVKRPRDRGSSLAGMIRRTSKRGLELRAEQRFAPPSDGKSLRIDEDSDAETLDMSTSGLCVTTASGKGIGATVKVHFAGFDEIDGRVVWRNGQRAGIALPSEALDLRVI